MLSAGVRSGGHRASGPGRHWGAASVAAAAAPISPAVSQPPPTASGHTGWDMKRIFHDDRRGRGWLARRSWQKPGAEGGGGGGRFDQRRILLTAAPVWQVPPAPTATQQLRAAFYSCTPPGNRSQHSSPSPFLPLLP